MATTDYELVLMLDPQTGEDERGKIASEAKSKLESAGTLTHEADWGMRKMAYEIEQRTEADYRYYRFSGEKPLLDDLNHSLKITDGVLRFRIFKLEADAPVMVPPDTETIMRRDEDDDRGRGRGRRDDRGPRRPREDTPADAPAPAATEASAAPAEAPAEATPDSPSETAVAEAPADAATDAPRETAVAEAPAEPAAEPVAEAPAEPAAEPAAEAPAEPAEDAPAES